MSDPKTTPLPEMPQGAGATCKCLHCGGSQRLRDARGEYICWHCDGNGNVPASRPPLACGACGGRGYLGEPFQIYEEPAIGEQPSPLIRYGVETCPMCKGSGRRA